MLKLNKNFIIKDLPKYSIIIFIILNAIAMFFYAGGNMNDPKQIGYSFFNNFFSDLGMFESHSGNNNIVSSMIFGLSLFSIGSTFGLLFYTVRNIFSNYKILSFFGTFFGLFGSICYIGVALTPSDLFIDMHIFFAHWIFRSLFISSMIYSYLILKTKNFKNSYAYGFITFGLIVFVYIFCSEFYFKDPRLHPEFLFKHVVAQKMIVIWIIFAIYFYSIGLGEYLLKINDNNH